MAKIKGPFWQRANNPANCSICGKISGFKFYTVQSCEGCKQFFRRLVIGQTQYFCSSNGNCDISKVKCRGCRLDKCLRMGMDPKFVYMENKKEHSKIVKALELRRAAILNLKLPPEEYLSTEDGDEGNEYRKKGSVYSAQFPAMHKKIFDNLLQDCKQIEYFTRILSAHRRLAQRCFDLPEEYLNKFSEIEQVLDGRENILSLADCYSQYPDNWSDAWIAKLYGEMIECGIRVQHPLIKKGHVVYHLMVVGVLKAMPIYGHLGMEDKITLIRELGHQINNLTSAFYSMEKSEMSVTGPRGLSLIGVSMQKYKEIPCLLKIAPKVFVHPNEAFRRIPMLSKEEFALLIPIMCSNPAISGLSPHAKELLYNDQCHYAHLLLKHCQHQAGNGAKGAQRFGECLQLIECAFRAVANFELITTYVEIFLTQKHFYDEVAPECIKSLIK